MLLRSAGAARSEGTPLWPVGSAGKTHTRSSSMHPSTPRRSSGHFQRNFDTSNYGGLGSDRSIPGPNRRWEERQTDNRLRSRQRLGPSLSASTASPPPPPGGLFKASASASRCMFTHHYCPLSFPHRRRLVSAPSFKEGSGGERRSAVEGGKTASGQA